MRLVFSAVVLASFVVNAQAQSLDEKLCVFNAAAKVPAGVQATGSSLSPIGLSDAATEAAGTFSDAETGADTINTQLFPLSARSLDDVHNANQSGESSQATKMLANAIASGIVGGTDVKLAVDAAGQKLSLNYVCIWTASGRIFVAPRGASD